MLRPRLAPQRNPRPALLATLVLAVLSGTLAVAAPPVAPSSGAHSLAGYEIVRIGRGNLNRLATAATIDGVKGLLMIDTGAAVTALTAEKYGFLLKNGVERPKNLPATLPLNEMRAPMAVAGDVQLGEIHLARKAFPLVPQRYLYQNLLDDNRQYDGLLGENFLRLYNAVLDCGRLALYLNTDPHRKLDLSSALTHKGWTQIPMSTVHNDFLVPCTVGGHPFRLIVDTGAAFTTLDAYAVRGVHVEQKPLPMRGSILGYQPVEYYLVQADTLQIGNYEASNVHMVSDEGIKRTLTPMQSSTDEPPVLGLLGGDILAANGAMIDIGNHNLYLKHTGASAPVATQ